MCLTLLEHEDVFFTWDNFNYSSCVNIYIMVRLTFLTEFFFFFINKTWSREDVTSRVSTHIYIYTHHKNQPLTCLTLLAFLLVLNSWVMSLVGDPLLAKWLVKRKNRVLCHGINLRHYETLLVMRHWWSDLKIWLKHIREGFDEKQMKILKKN